MLRKSYRNLEFVNSFAVPISSRRKKALGSDLFLFSFLSFCFPIRISELGPVQTGRPPPGRGGGWESESLGVFNTRQESGNGTRELRTGSRSVLQWDPNPRMGPKCNRLVTLLQRLLQLTLRSRYGVISLRAGGAGTSEI